MEEYAKKQYRMSRFTAFCAVCMLIIVAVSALILVPSVLHTLGQINTAMEHLDSMAGEVSDVTDDLKAGVESLRNAAERLDNLDFSKLNDAISDLRSVVEPLAKLFGK